MVEKSQEEKDLEAELRSLQEEAEAEEVARAEASRLASLKDQVEAARREAADQKMLSSLVEKHGQIGKKIQTVPSPVGMVVVRKPNHLHFKRFQDKGDTKSEDLDRLVSTCLVHPDKAKFDQMVEECPALLMKAANAVCKLAGIGRDDLGGK